MDVKQDIAALDVLITETPMDATLYVKRGKLHYSANNFGAALNDFNQALVLDPDLTEAQGFVKIINEILKFHNTDILNP